jgi:hypothetical protein
MISRGFLFISILAATLFAGCSKDSFPVRKTEKHEFRDRAESSQPGSRYRLYNISELKIRYEQKKGAVFVRAVIESSAGNEVVNMIGLLDENGSASLTDVNPLPDGQLRMIGSVLCLDEVCEKAIIDTYINVDGHGVKKRFVSNGLKENAAKTAATSIDIEDYDKLVKRPTTPVIVADSQTPDSKPEVTKDEIALVADGNATVLDKEPTEAKSGEATADDNPLAGDDQKK